MGKVKGAGRAKLPVRAFTRAEHAIIAVVRERDWVTLPELQDALRPLLPVEGEHYFSLASLPNGILWVGVSQPLITALLTTVTRGVVRVVPVARTVYDQRGTSLTLPVFDAQTRPLSEVARVRAPHWVPICLRPGH